MPSPSKRTAYAQMEIGRILKIDPDKLRKVRITAIDEFFKVEFIVEGDTRINLTDLMVPYRYAYLLHMRPNEQSVKYGDERIVVRWVSETNTTHVSHCRLY